MCKRGSIYEYQKYAKTAEDAVADGLHAGFEFFVFIFRIIALIPMRLNLLCFKFNV